MLNLLIRITKMNPAIARTLVHCFLSFQDLASRPRRVLWTHHGCISIEEYNDLVTCYLARGETIARLKHENALLRRKLAYEVLVPTTKKARSLWN